MKRAKIKQLGRGVVRAVLIALSCFVASIASASEPAEIPEAELSKTRDQAHSVGLEVAGRALSVASRSSLSPRARMLIEQVERERWSIDQVLDALALSGVSQCLDFQDTTHLQERKARWREAVRLLALTHPEDLNRWILGQRPPPRAVLMEANTQLRCLIAAMAAASGSRDHGFRLFLRIRDHFGGRFANESEMADHLERYPRTQDQVLRALLRSDYRDLGSQGWIWNRKMRFTGRSFNKISESAAARCGLTPGHTWKPDSTGHKRCWFDELGGPEREQEVLLASAAPGLSRHHWGSEFDILGLNPRLFEEGGPLHQAWVWMEGQALDYGFFQPFGPPGAPGELAHMEERWHWSYYPVGQAIWEHLLEREHIFEAVLHDLWSSLERRWGARNVQYFEHMRRHWRDYLFHIAVPPLPRALP